MAGAREWQRARPQARERAPGGGGKTGWTSPAFPGCWLLQPRWIWVRETGLEEDPRAFPTLRKDTGGVASGRSRGHTQCWGEPGRPQRNGRIRVLQTTLEQKAGGLRVGQGGGAAESYCRPSAGPAGKFSAPKRSLWKLPHSGRCKGRTQSSRDTLLPCPHLRLPPHTGRGSLPPRVGLHGGGSGTEYLSSPGRRGYKRHFPPNIWKP